MSRLFAGCLAIIVLSAIVDGADDAKSTATKLNQAWQAAYKAADFDRLAHSYAEDAVLMPTGREPVQGREAIRNFFVQDLKYFLKHSITLKTLRVEASGSVLVDCGEYRFDGVDIDGKPIQITGSYITVFKKTNGNWHTAIEIWNVRSPEESK